VGLIAALKDTLDEGLAALLVAAPSVTRDPALLAALAHLPVAPDSAYRRSDGGMVYVTALTGYANARNTADMLLWKQSLTLITAPSTPHDVLLTIATWNDRHFFFCGPPPSPRQVFPALRERAVRERDTTILAALARERLPCK
jgi:NAD(P)H-flavin reductase